MGKFNKPEISGRKYTSKIPAASIKRVLMFRITPDKNNFYE
jgi:hypothetical protein